MKTIPFLLLIVLIGFGCKKDSDTAKLPTISTNSITDITQTSAVGGGNVTSDGDASVTAKGVCWNTTGTPTISDSKTIDGAGIGTFTSSLKGLKAGTNYYVRAFATNSAGTNYGQEVPFITNDPTPGTFTDSRDDNTYSWVKIGTQIWMSQNLAYMPAVRLSSEGSEADPYYYVYGYEGSTVTSAKATANYTIYGVLFNWPAALTACPSGWHLPTDDEWKILEMNQGMSEYDANTEGWRYSGAVGGKLKESGTTHWSSPNTDATNTSGFTALPGGYRTIDGGFNRLSVRSYFWSSSENGAYAWCRPLSYDTESVGLFYFYRSHGFSVRCLKNN